MRLSCVGGCTSHSDLCLAGSWRCSADRPTWKRLRHVLSHPWHHILGVLAAELQLCLQKITQSRHERVTKETTAPTNKELSLQKVSVVNTGLLYLSTTISFVCRNVYPHKLSQDHHSWSTFTLLSALDQPTLMSLNQCNKNVAEIYLYFLEKCPLRQPC